jgi:Ran-binding protein 1
MFRFVEASKEWKERGTGDVRFLRHKENKKIRVLMRAEKTLRVRANHPRQYPPSPCPRSRA